MERTNAPASLALSLLENGHDLGLDLTQNLCERVLRFLRATGDATALRRAWVFARARQQQPTCTLALIAASGLADAGQGAAGKALLDRFTAAGGKLSPLGQRLHQQLKGSASSE